AAAGEAVLQLAVELFVADRDEARLQLECLLDQSVDIAVRRKCINPVVVGIAFHHVDRAAADRAGRAQDGDPALTLGLRIWPRFGHSHVSPLLPITALMTATAAATAISPSTRSRAPPCPGIILLASLTPKWRLKADSARSPACSTIASPALSAARGRIEG